MKDFRRKFRRSIFHPLSYGFLTGIVTGAVLSLFLVCSRIIIDFVFGLYQDRTPLTVVCILTLAVLCCLLTAVIQTLCPAARGSGIPLAEGSARGMLRVKWLSTAAALISGSLLAFMCGMPLGSEGPSVGVGGLIGEGVGKTAKKPVEFRRYLITGGASAGLATAFNAPLTGICFAFEETHRRFSPSILASAFAAVVAAVITSQAMFYGFGKIPYLNSLGIDAGFCVLTFLKPSAYAAASDFFKVCGIALLLGGACAAFGIAFNRATAALSKLFKKVKSATIRLLPAFLFSAVMGLSLYLNIGSGEATLASVGTDTALWLLITVLAVRFVSTAFASGSGATGGLFLPMIAIGGLIGIIAAKACGAAGLNEAYLPNITVICICAFFAASVHAPITAIALSVELTASFVNLLPCIIAVAAATILAGATKTEPLYERMLSDIQSSTPLSSDARSLTVNGAIPDDSPIALRRVRDIMWPYNSLVTDLIRDGVHLVPDGETTLKPNDIITVRAENVDQDMFYTHIQEYIETEEKHASPPASPDATVVSTAKNIAKS